MIESIEKSLKQIEKLLQPISEICKELQEERRYYREHKNDSGHLTTEVKK